MNAPDSRLIVSEFDLCGSLGDLPVPLGGDVLNIVTGDGIPRFVSIPEQRRWVDFGDRSWFVIDNRVAKTSSEAGELAEVVCNRVVTPVRSREVVESPLDPDKIFNRNAAFAR